MRLEPSTDPSVADWLFDQPRPWYEKTYGPKGFEAYAHLRFVADPEPWLADLWQLAVAVSKLSRFTSTPSDCHFLIWDGWPDNRYRGSNAARIDLMERGSEIPLRTYHLFEGDLDLFGWQDDSHYPATRRQELPDPAFIWPADHAWFVADDVDPEFATIGGSAAAIAELLTETRIDVVAAAPP